MKKEKSCGAAVYKYENGKRLYLLEHMVQGHISLPKGHVEQNETETETAEREIREETNLTVKLDTNFRCGMYRRRNEKPGVRGKPSGMGGF